MDASQTDLAVTDFETDVLRESFSQPVLVDFWAPWCGPCRVLGPILERLAESDSRWKLAKVNTDEFPELSMEYQIRGIPAVKLFANGKVIDEFVGALPEHAVKQWLDKALPSRKKQLLDEAQNLIHGGAARQAQSLLEEVLKEDPSSDDARVLLAQVIVFQNPDLAEDLTTDVFPADPALLQVSAAVKDISRLLKLREQLDTLPASSARPDYVSAIESLGEMNFEAALSHFINVIQKDRYFDEDGARRACVALFTVLGEQHPATRAFRRRFDMALY